MAIGVNIGPKSVRVGSRIGSPTNDTAADTTLTVAIADSADPVITAVNFTYAVVVTNTGSVEAANVEAVVVLDATLTYVSASGSGWTCNESSGTITCTRAALAVGAAPTITVTVTSAGTASTETTTADAAADNAPAATQDSETTVVKLVSRDATSLIRCPASATEWSDFVAYHVAIGTADFPATLIPAALWLMQEASGNPADTVASFTLTATGAPSYQQTETGWTRKSLRMTADGDADDSFTTTSASLPDIGTGSLSILGYVSMPTAAGAAARNLIGLGAVATRATAEWTNAAKILCRCVGNSATGTAVPTNAIRPVWLQVNDTAGSVATFTDQEKVIPADAARAGKKVSFGVHTGGGQNAAACGYLYAVAFVTGSAELTQAQLKSAMTALGWSPAWTAA